MEFRRASRFRQGTSTVKALPLIAAEPKQAIRIHREQACLIESKRRRTALARQAHRDSLRTFYSHQHVRPSFSPREPHSFADNNTRVRFCDFWQLNAVDLPVRGIEIKTLKKEVFTTPLPHCDKNSLAIWLNKTRSFSAVDPVRHPNLHRVSACEAESHHH